MKAAGARERRPRCGMGWLHALIFLFHFLVTDWTFLE